MLCVEQNMYSVRIIKDDVITKFWTNVAANNAALNYLFDLIYLAVLVFNYFIQQAV